MNTIIIPWISLFSFSGHLASKSDTKCSDGHLWSYQEGSQFSLGDLIEMSIKGGLIERIHSGKEDLTSNGINATWIQLQKGFCTLSMFIVVKIVPMLIQPMKHPQKYNISFFNFISAKREYNHYWRASLKLLLQMIGLFWSRRFWSQPSPAAEAYYCL